MNVQQMLDAVDKLTIMECYQVHAKLGERLKRRMFYQLTFNAPWARTTIHCDHTDRFYEVCDQLASLIVESLNYEHVDPKKLPTCMFHPAHDSPDNVGDIKSDYRDEQTLHNIFYQHLDPSLYSFNVEQFEVSF